MKDVGDKLELKCHKNLCFCWMNLMHNKTNLVGKKIDELNTESAIAPKNMTNVL